LLSVRTIGYNGEEDSGGESGIRTPLPSSKTRKQWFLADSKISEQWVGARKLGTSTIDPVLWLGRRNNRKIVWEAYFVVGDRSRALIGMVANWWQGPSFYPLPRSN
jgi:hypothetical protein